MDTKDKTHIKALLYFRPFDRLVQAFVVNQFTQTQKRKYNRLTKKENVRKNVHNRRKKDRLHRKSAESDRSLFAGHPHRKPRVHRRADRVRPRHHGDRRGGIEAQTRQVLTNLKHVLEAADSGLNFVVKTTVFLQA
jgi:hypothetical protein